MKQIDNTEYWRRIVTDGVHRVCDSLSESEIEALTEHYGAHNYHPLPVCIVRGKGHRVWDINGVEYIDCIGGYSALSHGHVSPFLVETLQAQSQVLALTGRAVYTSELALFLQALCTFTGSEMALPMNTGAEAVETAIKVARKWAYTVNGAPSGRAEIIVANGNFHGRTTTLVGFSSEDAYRQGFGPFTPGFVPVPFGDSVAIERAITPNTAAVLLEPIQAEAGVVVPPRGYLASARRICDDAGVLLIWDEVQTGFCRTGTTFAWEHEDAAPDLMCVGKALGGGLLPVSAVVGRQDVLGVLTPGDHGSTFGGNSLSCAVAIASMAEMETRCYASNADRMGQRLLSSLTALDHPLATAIRGSGLLIGVEVASKADIDAIAAAFLNNGILTRVTHKRTFRLSPPLTIDIDIVDDITERVGKALDSVTSRRVTMPKAA